MNSFIVFHWRCHNTGVCIHGSAGLLGSSWHDQSLRSHHGENPAALSHCVTFGCSGRPRSPKGTRWSSNAHSSYGNLYHHSGPRCFLSNVIEYINGVVLLWNTCYSLGATSQTRASPPPILFHNQIFLFGFSVSGGKKGLIFMWSYRRPAAYGVVGGWITRYDGCCPNSRNTQRKRIMCLCRMKHREKKPSVICVRGKVLTARAACVRGVSSNDSNGGTSGRSVLVQVLFPLCPWCWRVETKADWFPDIIRLIYV